MKFVGLVLRVIEVLMKGFDYCYEVIEIYEGSEIAFLFMSESANREILKMIQYRYVRHDEGKPVYNLGFGDFNSRTGDMNDGALTGNGDVYKVFNTVLSTILLFYKHYPGYRVLVRGSDGKELYRRACKLTCNRNCGENCRRHNRRMKTYCAFVSRNYTFLESDSTLWVE